MIKIDAVLDAIDKDQVLQYIETHHGKFLFATSHLDLWDDLPEVKEKLNNGETVNVKMTEWTNDTPNDPK